MSSRCCGPCGREAATTCHGCAGMRTERTCENAWGTFFYPCLLSTHQQQLGDDCRRHLPGRRPSLSTSGPSCERQISPDPTHVGPSAPTRTQSPYCGVTGRDWDSPAHQRPSPAWPPREGTYEGARDRDRQRRSETHGGDRRQRSSRPRCWEPRSASPRRLSQGHLPGSEMRGQHRDFPPRFCACRTATGRVCTRINEVNIDARSLKMFPNCSLAYRRAGDREGAERGCGGPEGSLRGAEPCGKFTHLPADVCVPDRFFPPSFDSILEIIP